MVNNGGYNRLSTDLPLHPPGYDDLESNLADGVATPQIEEFEIEDDDPIQREGFLIRASLATKKFASNFSNKVVRPVSKMIDPMYEAYKYFGMQYEQVILKVGNPLVVKRLLYVFMITVLMFAVSKMNPDYGINGASGGTFTSGKFYDINLLGDTISDIIDVKQMKENLEYFSSMPHIAGTKGDLTLAKYIENYMENNGIGSPDFNEPKSFVNYPLFNEAETYVKLSDDSYKATLFELDNKEIQYLAYNPNSLNTNSPLDCKYIYANFGNPEDFVKLHQNKINIEGSIILIKYGGSIPESTKVNIAQSFGAKAVLFVTPKFTLGNGENKKEYDNIIQKENVGFSRISPGDVLTPASSSGDGFSTRVPWFKSELTPKIPTIPLSWKDGEFFIKKLDGKGIKMDSDFYSGDSNSDLKITFSLKNEERSTQEIWNVVGSILGREQSEEGIIIGAARDASCFGTLSSNTGSVVLLELMKVFTSLQRRFNWSPSRSIYFVSFDATQYNLAGSSDWIQSRIDILRNNGFAYIDLSDAVTGDILQISSNPFFQNLIKDSLKKVKVEDKNLYDIFKNQSGGDSIGNDMVEMKNYIPFINLANIPSLEIKFKGTTYPEGSCYDNFENFENSGIDPSMEKHKQLVNLLALISLELAELPVIPYDYEGFANSFLDYLKDLENYANDVVSGLSHKPSVSFDILKNSLEILKSAGKAHNDWNESWRQFIKASPEPSLYAMERWKRNQRMIEFNACFIIKNLNTKRPGYLNVLLGTPYWAPSTSLGKYMWNSFPILRDLIYENKFEALQHDIKELSDLIVYASNNFVNLI